MTFSTTARPPQTMPHAWQPQLTWPDTAIYIAAAVLISLVARFLLTRLISRGVSNARRRAKARGDARLVQRTEAMASLLRSVVSVFTAAIAILYILDALGMNLAPILTSAGVGGVALGIGAQSLVKDFLSGVFMILEDQFGVGDVIDMGEVTGTVEEISLRITRLRDENGVIWYVRNGEILRVANRSQGEHAAQPRGRHEAPNPATANDPAAPDDKGAAVAPPGTMGSS